MFTQGRCRSCREVTEVIPSSGRSWSWSWSLRRMVPAGFCARCATELIAARERHPSSGNPA